MRYWNKEGIMEMASVKLLLVLLVFGILIFAAYHYGTRPTEDEAAFAVTVRLTDKETGEAAQGQVTNEDNVAAATAVTTTIFAVDQWTPYEIEYWVSYEATPPENVTEPLYGDAEMWGETFYWAPDDIQFINDDTGEALMEIENQQLMPPGYNNTAAFTKANGQYWDDTNNGVMPLYGYTLDGSVWHCTITVSSAYAGTDAYYGVLEITITLDVDVDGNVNISVTDVDMTATEV